MVNRIAYFIESVANALFILCTVGLLFALRSLMVSRRELHNAEYVLDREHAQYRQANAITWTIGVIEIALAIFAISHVVAPTLRNDAVPGATVTVNGAQPFYTSTPPLSTDSGIVLTAEAKNVDTGPQVQSTATNAPTAVGTIKPDVPQAVGCDKPGATLQIPANGQVLFDSVTVIGTANTANFAYYKFEISGPPTGNSYAPITGNKTTAVTQTGVLGQLALGSLPRGTYLFRLTVFDNTNKLQASCAVTVILQALSTSTPTPTPSS